LDKFWCVFASGIEDELHWQHAHKMAQNKAKKKDEEENEESEDASASEEVKEKEKEKEKETSEAKKASPREAQPSPKQLSSAASAPILPSLSASATTSDAVGNVDFDLLSPSSFHLAALSRLSAIGISLSEFRLFYALFHRCMTGSNVPMDVVSSHVWDRFVGSSRLMMHADSFGHALFELVDLWLLTHIPDDFVNTLKAMYVRMTIREDTPHGKRTRWRTEEDEEMMVAMEGMEEGGPASPSGVYDMPKPILKAEDEGETESGANTGRRRQRKAEQEEMETNNARKAYKQIRAVLKQAGQLQTEADDGDDEENDGGGDGAISEEGEEGEDDESDDLVSDSDSVDWSAASSLEESGSEAGEGEGEGEGEGDGDASKTEDGGHHRRLLTRMRTIRSKRLRLRDREREYTMAVLPVLNSSVAYFHDVSHLYLSNASRTSSAAAAGTGKNATNATGTDVSAHSLHGLGVLARQKSIGLKWSVVSQMMMDEIARARQQRQEIEMAKARRRKELRDMQKETPLELEEEDIIEEEEEEIEEGEAESAHRDADGVDIAGDGEVPRDGDDEVRVVDADAASRRARRPSRASAGSISISRLDRTPSTDLRMDGVSLGIVSPRSISARSGTGTGAGATSGRSAVGTHRSARSTTPAKPNAAPVTVPVDGLGRHTQKRAASREHRQGSIDATAIMLQDPSGDKSSHRQLPIKAGALFPTILSPQPANRSPRSASAITPRHLYSSFDSGDSDVEDEEEARAARQMRAQRIGHHWPSIERVLRLGRSQAAMRHRWMSAVQDALQRARELARKEAERRKAIEDERVRRKALRHARIAGIHAPELTSRAGSAGKTRGASVAVTGASLDEDTSARLQQLASISFIRGGEKERQRIEALVAQRAVERAEERRLKEQQALELERKKAEREWEREQRALAKARGEPYKPKPYPYAHPTPTNKSDVDADAGAAATVAMLAGRADGSGVSPWLDGATGLSSRLGRAGRLPGDLSISPTAATIVPATITPIAVRSFTPPTRVRHHQQQHNHHQQQRQVPHSHADATHQQHVLSHVRADTKGKQQQTPQEKRLLQQHQQQQQLHQQYWQQQHQHGAGIETDAKGDPTGDGSGTAYYDQIQQPLHEAHFIQSVMEQERQAAVAASQAVSGYHSSGAGNASGAAALFIGSPSSSSSTPPSPLLRPRHSTNHQFISPSGYDSTPALNGDHSVNASAGMMAPLSFMTGAAYSTPMHLAHPSSFLVQGQQLQPRHAHAVTQVQNASQTPVQNDDTTSQETSSSTSSSHSGLQVKADRQARRRTMPTQKKSAQLPVDESSSENGDNIILLNVDDPQMGAPFRSMRRTQSHDRIQVIQCSAPSTRLASIAAASGMGFSTQQIMATAKNQNRAMTPPVAFQLPIPTQATAASATVSTGAAMGGVSSSGMFNTSTSISRGRSSSHNGILSLPSQSASASPVMHALASGGPGLGASSPVVRSVTGSPAGGHAMRPRQQSQPSTFSLNRTATPPPPAGQASAHGQSHAQSQSQSQSHPLSAHVQSPFTSPWSPVSVSFPSPQAPPLPSPLHTHAHAHAHVATQSQSSQSPFQAQLNRMAIYAATQGRSLSRQPPNQSHVPTRKARSARSSPTRKGQGHGQAHKHGTHTPDLHSALMVQEAHKSTAPTRTRLNQQAPVAVSRVHSHGSAYGESRVGSASSSKRSEREAIRIAS